MKGKSCMKKGGKVMTGGDVKKGGDDKEDETAKMKKGGKVHKAEGHKAKHRIDKKARGGKIATPKSPLSGAEPKGLPGGGKGMSAPLDKEMD